MLVYQLVHVQHREIINMDTVDGREQLYMMHKLNQRDVMLTVTVTSR